MRHALALLALAMAGPAFAQTPPAAAPAADADVRVNQLLIYGSDPCPRSTSADEIIVCARLPEDDRFRIPTNLRPNPNDPANRAWANRAIELSYVGATGIGSCSPTGPGGMTGCFNQLVTAARAERAGSETVNWNQLIEQARQERLSRIDQAARDEEQPQAPPAPTQPPQP